MKTQIIFERRQRALAGIAVVVTRPLIGYAGSTGWAVIRWASIAAVLMLTASSSFGQSFFFSTGDPDGRMATASRPSSGDLQEIESADDFVLTNETFIRQATFTGLVPSGTDLSHVSEVIVEIYRVFPKDS